MANVMADMQYAFALNEAWVGNRFTDRSDKALRGLWRKAKKSQAEGRGLDHYFGFKSRGRGRHLRVAENGTYPVSGVPTTGQAKVTAKLGVLACGYSDHEQQLFKSKGSKYTRETVASDLAAEVELTRDRILGHRMGRSDNVVARVAAAVSSSTTVYSLTPIRCVVGDLVYSYPTNSATGDERGFGGTEELAADRYVTAIYPDAKATSATYEGWLTLDTADSLTQYSVLTVKGAVSGSSAVEPTLGWEDHFDSVNDNSFQWDSTDDTTYDNRTTYAGLTCSTTPQTNVGLINASSDALSLNYMTRAAQACLAADQSSENRLVAVMNPFMWDRLMVTFQGQVPRDTKVGINGVDFTLPYIATAGAGRMPIITSYLHEDGFVTVLPQDCLHVIWSPVGWDKPLLRREGDGSGGFKAKSVAYWRYFSNTYCDMPYRATVIFGLDTSNT